LRLVYARQGQLALFQAHDDHVAARKIAEDSNIAKSQFLATMSHELRTPLNAVIGYAEILEEDLGADGKTGAASDARRIRRAARDLLALINEVLDLSKIEAGRMDVVSERAKVADIVADVVETTAHIAAANANHVVVKVDPATDELILDAGKLRQCLLNLVSNACKFTKAGEIAIDVTLYESADGPRLRVCVSDTGVGIAPDQAGRLFKPFVQADGSHTREHGGTGLGLVITRRLAQLMGGDVEMQSELGRGSRFTLTIATQRPAKAIAERRPEGADPVVLLIEDDSTARDLCRRALARLPLRVVCATTADEGARMAAEVDPALIVMDIHFPDRLGWDLLAEFKANPLLAETPVLVVSIDDDRARAMTLGACDHLIKPVDRDRLAAAVLRFARLPIAAAGAAAKSAITKAA
jgi:nitrogen-specific signal transduction histidine kinase/CheY-like chemotaxis protein